MVIEILIIIFSLLWLVFWTFLYPRVFWTFLYFLYSRFKFKNKCYIKNEELLKLDYEAMTQYVYRLEIIGVSVLLAGLTMREPLIIDSIK